jgi:tetratricopeptide (TPR) repeat protein
VGFDVAKPVPLWCVFALCSWVPTLAAAEEAYPDEVAAAPEDGQEPFVQGEGGDPQALILYQEAEELYDEGRYQEAVTTLVRVLEIDPNAPELYYNIALVYEHLNEYDRALEYLDRYSQFEIDGDERQRVERMMVRIRGARAHAPSTPEPQTRTRVVVQRFGRADGWFWSMVAATILFGGGACITGGLALDWADAADEFVLGPDGDEDEHQYWVYVADSLALTTDVLIGAASAAAVTALLLYVLRTHSEVDDSTDGEGGEDGEGDNDGFAGAASGASPGRAWRAPTIQVGLGAVMIGWEL